MVARVRHGIYGQSMDVQGFVHACQTLRYQASSAYSYNQQRRALAHALLEAAVVEAMQGGPKTVSQLAEELAERLSSRFGELWTWGDPSRGQDLLAPWIAKA